MASNRVRPILYGLLGGALTVLGIIVAHGIRRGWDELSEPGYWLEKAAIFAIVTVIFAVFASFQRPAP